MKLLKRRESRMGSGILAFCAVWFQLRSRRFINIRRLIIFGWILLSFVFLFCVAETSELYKINGFHKIFHSPLSTDGILICVYDVDFLLKIQHCRAAEC